MKENTQSRKYQLTINNPTSCGMNRENCLTELMKLSLDYFCLADEIAKTGTLHTHIFIYSISPIRFSTLKNRFPVAHIEKAYGTVTENRNYILKEGKWKDSDKAETRILDSFFEHGDIPSEQAEKEPDKTRLLEWIADGMSTYEIVKKNPNYAFKVKDIDSLRETILSDKYLKENRNIKVTYLYGETGTGKTRSIYDKYMSSDVCRITTYKGDKVLFDAYHGQAVLVFEEYRSQIPIAEMLSYLDIYPLMLPARYSDRVACYTQVYIVTNIPLYQQYRYERMNETETWRALIRRIDAVFHQIGPVSRFSTK